MIDDESAAAPTMNAPPSDNSRYNERLLEVIRTQTEIARLGLDLGSVMSLVAERTQALTRAIGGVVELAEGDDMVYRAATGIAAAHLGLRLRRDNSISGLCVRVGKALRCDDAGTDERVDREACRRIGLRSMIVVPLRHGETVVGVLKVLGREPKAFDDTDLQILDLMSGLIAAAMFHAGQHDISDLFYRATHDALTGLANRSLFFDRLRLNLDQAQRESQCVGVLNLDMDGLKPINDYYGHRFGDAAIRELAIRVKQNSRASDTVARIGGDEFGMILMPVDDRFGVESYAQRLSERIARPFTFESIELPLRASLGVAMFPDDSREAVKLFERADQSMYTMKRERKSLERRASDTSLNVGDAPA